MKIEKAVAPARIERAENAVDRYRKVEAEIVALSEDEVGRVTTDVGQAVSIALGARENLEQLRPEFKRLNDEGAAIKALDTLEDYAMASFFAHLQVVPDGTSDDVKRLLEQGRPIRAKLLKVAESLVSFDIFAEKTVSAIRKGSGHLDAAKDLVALGALFNSNWEIVKNKVPFELDLVEQASTIGPQLLRAIGAKGVGEVRKDPSYDWLSLRKRAFRLLVNAYEELRRATSYVRWYDGDAKDFTPSLHARAASTTKRNQSATSEPEEREPPSNDLEQLGANELQVEAGLPGAAPFSG